MYLYDQLRERAAAGLKATGDPVAGIADARAPFAVGRHIVMVSVEADVLVRPLLAAEARAAGVVYTMACGDQPALTCELVEWARSCGFGELTWRPASSTARWGRRSPTPI